MRTKFSIETSKQKRELIDEDLLDEDERADRNNIIAKVDEIVSEHMSKIIEAIGKYLIDKVAYN